MADIYIKDLIQLPQQVNRGDFVLRLAEGITEPERTITDYVVTPQLRDAFDHALKLIRGAVEGRSSKGAYLHGSFGSGKSHFMAILHLLLEGNISARSIPELAGVVATHNSWMEGKKFLLVPFHLIGAKSLESAVLGGYVRHLATVHPTAPTPAVYRSDQLLNDADALRANLGDAKFFETLNARAGSGEASDGWGSVSSTWTAAHYDQARRSGPETADRQQLVGDLIDTFFRAMIQTDQFVNLDDGLAVLSAHAKSLGYDALILFLDELILWLASHAADLNFVSSEAQKVPKLVESERGDRPVPIVSFVARQRDLRELIGQHVPGASRLGFSDVLSYWEGRFDLIKLEDRNLPVIAERRILRPKSPEAKQAMDSEFTRTAATREEVMRVLLTTTGNRDDFRKLYPFSPALVETLVAVSSLLQRERTALKIMLQLLVKHRDTLKLGQIVPVGDLYDEIAQGDEAFSADMKAHFDSARKLYLQHLRPVLEAEHGLSFDEAAELGVEDTRRRGLLNDDRLLKTLLLAALAPAVESLKNMTPARLAALNHGTIKSPIPGQEATTVLNKCKKWAAAVGQIKIQEAAGAPPTIQLQLSGVDIQSIIEQAEAVDNHGNRIRKLKELLFGEFEIPTQQELFSRHSFRWRGTDRDCEVLVGNVREVPTDTLATGGEVWRLIIDYPFDQPGHSVRQDLGRLEEFRASGKTAKTVCWLPSFFSHKALEQLGRLVRLDHILTENRFPTFVSHLSEVDRAAARALLQNQCDVLKEQFKAQAEMCYGLRGPSQEYLDPANTLEASEHFQSLEPSIQVRPPAASNFREALQLILDQVLRTQFPGHPSFSEDVSLTRASVQKVFETIQEGVRSAEPSVFVGDQNSRKHLQRIAVPLRLGEMGENRFQVSHHWKQHFERQIHQLDPREPVNVRRMRAWIDTPTPMGLPALLQDLLILVFAEQTNRSFSLHTAPQEAVLGGLDSEMVLKETPLPSRTIWEAAQSRSKAIFGLDCSPHLNATNLASLAGQIRSVIGHCRGPVKALPKSLQEACRTLGLTSEPVDRLTVATQVEALLQHLETARDDADLIQRIGQVALTSPEPALGASLMQSAAVLGALQQCRWTIFTAVRVLADERQGLGQEVWNGLIEAMKSNELAVGLAASLGALQDRAIGLLAAPTRVVPAATNEKPIQPVGAVAPAPRPEPTGPSTPSIYPWTQSDFGTTREHFGGDVFRLQQNRQRILELKALYGQSQVEGDSLPSWVGPELREALLEVHLIRELSQGGADARSNMLVVTPTLHALIHLDPNAVIDLGAARLELPGFGLRLNLVVKPNHNG